MRRPFSVARRATAAAAARLLAAPTRARREADAGGHARGRPQLSRSRALSIVGSLLMIATLFAPVGGAIAPVAAADSPPGLEGVPAENVGPPEHANGPPVQAIENVPTDAAAWDVHAGKYADDLEVTIGATADDELALVFADERNHYGREVAVDASTLEDALGDRPAVAYGVHSSGDEWSSAIEYRDGYAILEIPKFSSNEVTFSGTVSLTGDPAEDGTSYSYDLADSEEVSDFSVELTGAINLERNDQSMYNVGPDTGQSLSVDGNLDPTGPSANNQPTVEFTGKTTQSKTDFEGTDGAFEMFGTSGGEAISSEMMVSQSIDTLTGVSFGIYDEVGDVSQPVDIYVVKDDGVDVVYGEGTLVKEGWDPSVIDGKGTYSVGFDEKIDASNADNVTIEFVTQSGGSGDNNARVRGTNVNNDQLSSDGTIDSHAPAVHLENPPHDVTMSDDAGHSVSLGNFGDTETKTGELPIDLSTSSVSWSGSQSGAEADLVFNIEERTESVDPSITVNGDTYQHTGTLAEDETVQLDVSEVSLESGTNDVSVTVSEDYSGPAGQVGLDYSHSAVDEQTVDYEAEAFSERYEVGKTYAYDADDAHLTIPFSTEVVDVRELEVRENDGDWTTVVESDYSLNDTDLSVEFGAVDANTTVEVRAAGSKVRPVNGEISVTRPTVLGEQLTSEIRLESVGSDFALEVGGTDYADELMYTYSESWSNPQTFSRTDSGAQEVRMPNAGEGATTRVSTLALGVEPASGHVDVRVLASGSEPEFQVLEETTATEIDFVWHDTVSGHVYQLYSLDADSERARGEAASPVTLTHDGTAEALRIMDLGTSGAGGGGGGTATAGGGLLSGPITLILAVTIALSGLYLLSQRTGDDSVSGRFLILLAVPIIGAVAIFALAPEIWSDALAESLGEALPLLAMFAAAGVFLWYRAARAPDEQVTFEFGDR